MICAVENQESGQNGLLINRNEAVGSVVEGNLNQAPLRAPLNMAVDFANSVSQHQYLLT